MEDERDVEKYLTKKVKSMGGLSFKWTCPGVAGVPDRICILPGGVIVFIEVKKSTGHLSQQQILIRKQLEGLGCRYEVVYGRSDVDWLTAILYSELPEQ
jgi:hypothetical protein